MQHLDAIWGQDKYIFFQYGFGALLGQGVDRGLGADNNFQLALLVKCLFLAFLIALIIYCLVTVVVSVSDSDPCSGSSSGSDALQCVATGRQKT